MKIWCENNSDNLYQAILHNKQVNIDIGDIDSQDDIPISVTINTYDKTNNKFLSAYSHCLTITQIITYIMSIPRYGKEYDFEIIRLDNNTHKDENLQLLNQALDEYTIIKNNMAETFDTEENKLILHKINAVINTLQDKIDEINIIDNNQLKI